ncbi:hypothetical protein OHD25_01770 [Escherichia coli]|nr:hypothetical protein [Escherichia coli]
MTIRCAKAAGKSGASVCRSGDCACVVTVG